MSEYIEIEGELGDGGLILFHTNLMLTAEPGEEYYTTPAELEEGSPVAQALAAIEGIETMTICGGEIMISTHPDADWHAVIADVTAALKDFFL